MRVLGIVGSARRVGNTEILVKDCLKGAREEGAEVVLMRASDLNIAACNGCMACLVRGEKCRLKDDLDWFGEELRKADGLVLGAPSYHYLPPAALLKIEDRIHGLLIKFDVVKKAVTIGTAASYRKAGFIIPVLNHCVGFLGFELVGSLLAISPGPGEVLLPEHQTMSRVATQLGHDMVVAKRDERAKLSANANRLNVFDPERDGDKLFSPTNLCPLCYSDSFFFVGPGQVQCKFCYGVRAAVTTNDGNVTLHFKDLADEESKRLMREHFGKFIKPTGDTYKTHIEEIKALRAPYRTSDIPWVAPPAA